MCGHDIYFSTYTAGLHSDPDVCLFVCLFVFSSKWKSSSQEILTVELNLNLYSFNCILNEVK